MTTSIQTPPMNEYIFNSICNQDWEKYNHYMEQCRRDFYETLDKISPVYGIDIIRINAFRLKAICKKLKNADEFVYVCRLILAIEPTVNDMNKYYPYLMMLSEIHTNNLF
jgi:hypothetical protein